MYFQLTIPHVMATLFWCKIFKVPELPKKHHIVGYEPLIDSRPIRNNIPVVDPTSQSPVHHMVLYECAEDDDKHLWNTWSEGDGYFGPNRPSAWATCATPIAAWAIGSQGMSYLNYFLRFCMNETVPSFFCRMNLVSQ